MNKAESISKRIQLVASKIGLTLESLKDQTDIHDYRLEAIWIGLAVPEYEELAMLSKALNVDEAVLLNDGAEKLWLRLKKIAQEWRFPRVWPILAQRTGLRGPDSPETDEALLDELILEDQKDRLDDPDDEFPFWRKDGGHELSGASNAQ